MVHVIGLRLDLAPGVLQVSLVVTIVRVDSGPRARTGRPHDTAKRAHAAVCYRFARWVFIHSNQSVDMIGAHFQPELVHEHRRRHPSNVTGRINHRRRPPEYAVLGTILETELHTVFVHVPAHADDATADRRVSFPIKLRMSRGKIEGMRTGW